MSFGVELEQGSSADERIMGKKMQGAQANISVLEDRCSEGQAADARPQARG